MNRPFRTTANDRNRRRLARATNSALVNVNPPANASASVASVSDRPSSNRSSFDLNCEFTDAATSPGDAFRQPIEPTGIYDQGSEPLNLFDHIEAFSEGQQLSYSSFLHETDNEEKVEVEGEHPQHPNEHNHPEVVREPLEPKEAPKPEPPLDPEAAPKPRAPEVILVPSDEEDEPVQQPMQQIADSLPEPEGYVARRGRVDPTYYDTYWLFADDIGDVIKTSPAISNGDCGYDSVQHSLRELLPNGSPIPDYLEPNHQGRMVLRRKLASFGRENSLFFLTMDDPGVVNLREEGFPQLYTNRKDSFQRNLCKISGSGFLNHATDGFIPHSTGCSRTLAILFSAR